MTPRAAALGAGESGPSRETAFARRWQVLVAAAELTGLVGLVAAEAGLRRAVPGTLLGRWPVLYALVLAGAYAAGFTIIKLFIALLYRADARRGGLDASRLASAYELLGEYDVDRAARAGLVALCVLVPFAFIGAAWVWILLSIAMLAMFWRIDARWDRWAACRAARRAEERSPGVPEPLSAFVERARCRGHEDLAILVDESEQTDSLPAACLPCTRRPVLWVSGRAVEKLPPDEIEALLAHELAHHELEHPRATQTILFRSRLLSALAVCLLVAVLVREGSTWRAAWLIPGVLTAWYVLRCVAAPVERARLRRQEREAHARGLEITARPEALANLVRRTRGDSTGRPGPLARLLDAAPPPEEVLALAERWEAPRPDDKL